MNKKKKNQEVNEKVDIIPGEGMSTQEVLNKLRKGITVQIGDYLILGKKDKYAIAFIFTNTEHKVLGVWDPSPQNTIPSPVPIKIFLGETKGDE